MLHAKSLTSLNVSLMNDVTPVPVFSAISSYEYSGMFDILCVRTPFYPGDNMVLLDENRFTFKMTLPITPQSNLILGRLYYQAKPVRQQEFVATSGIIGGQFLKSWVAQGRGPIPPSGAIGKFSYSIHTTRFWYPHVRGIEGSSYKIYPERVTVSQVTRSNFEVHFDAGYPGTAGCIGLVNQEDWDRYRELMHSLSSANIHVVPLNVVYA